MYMSKKANATGSLRANRRRGNRFYRRAAEFMVKEIGKKGVKLYRYENPGCGPVYREKEWTEKCEKYNGNNSEGDNFFGPFAWKKSFCRHEQ